VTTRPLSIAMAAAGPQQQLWEQLLLLMRRRRPGVAHAAGMDKINANQSYGYGASSGSPLFGGGGGYGVSEYGAGEHGL
jgi:hypothetical protein